jgi:hypothetical protein
MTTSSRPFFRVKSATLGPVAAFVGPARAAAVTAAAISKKVLLAITVAPFATTG